MSFLQAQDARSEGFLSTSREKQSFKQRKQVDMQASSQAHTSVCVVVLTAKYEVHTGMMRTDYTISIARGGNVTVCIKVLVTAVSCSESYIIATRRSIGSYGTILSKCHQLHQLMSSCARKASGLHKEPNEVVQIPELR